MNLIDIEAYTNKVIPTVSISNDLLVKPKPPVKMKGGRIKARNAGGKKQAGSRNRRGGPPRSHHQRNKKAV